MALAASVALTGPAVQTDADGRRVAGRRKRYALRASLWKLSGLTSVKGCGRNVAAPANGGDGVATLYRSANGLGGVGGLQLCSSIWSCPCCSARIRQDRAVDVEKAGVTWLRQEHSLYFLTLTMPHDAGDELAELLDALLGAWRAVQQRKRYRELRKSYGLRFIRAVEVTHTRRQDGGAGWHPHLHVLLFADDELTGDQRADYLGWLEAAWEKAVTSFRRSDGTRFRPPARDGIGVNLQDVHGKGGAGSAALLRYLAKVQDSYGESWSVGAELARGDLKTGRRAMSRTPFELAELAGMGDVPALKLWHEYELATKGRKALHWSTGLRELLDCPETPEVEVPEEVGEQLVVAVLSQSQVRELCRRPGLWADLLDLIELERYERVHELLDDAFAELPPAMVLSGNGSAGKVHPNE